MPAYTLNAQMTLSPLKGVVKHSRDLNQHISPHHQREERHPSKSKPIVVQDTASHLKDRPSRIQHPTASAS